MKLYYVSQAEVDGYDTYSDMVVAAENEERARKTYPSSSCEWSDQNSSWVFLYSDGRKLPERRSDWANNLELIKVEEIGTAKKGVKPGVICASYHAG